MHSEAIRWEKEGMSGDVSACSQSVPLSYGIQYGVWGEPHLHVSKSSSSELIDNARLRGLCRVPGGTMKIITATCSEQFSGGTMLFEPL